MENLTFLELAKKILTEENRPLAPSEIWKVAVSKGYDSLIDSQGKTPAATLYSAIFTDARDNADTRFIKLGARPARYFLRELAEKMNRNELEQSAASDEVIVREKYNYKESDLHRFLTYFVHRKFRAYSKTINHSTSRKDEFGEWLHPDMIGVYYLFEDWRKEVRDQMGDLSAATGGIRIKFYSFEIKKQLSFSNLREAFFQAVSNSSWANEGYLVAADVSTDEEFLAELRRLSASFKIGIIQLDLEEPDSSSVLFPAREREAVDWDALNKLAMNKDVEEILKRFSNDFSTKEIRKEGYDKILNSEELVNSIQPIKGLTAPAR